MLFLHDLSLYLLYLAFGLAVFLAFERTIFYMHANRQIKSLLIALNTKSALPEFKKGAVGEVVAHAFTNGLHPSASQKVADYVADRDCCTATWFARNHSGYI